MISTYGYTRNDKLLFTVVAAAAKRAICYVKTMNGWMCWIQYVSMPSITSSCASYQRSTLRRRRTTHNWVTPTPFYYRTTTPRTKFTSRQRLFRILAAILLVDSPRALAWNLCPTRRSILQSCGTTIGTICSSFFLDSPSFAKNLPEAVTVDTSCAGTEEALLPVLQLKGTLAYSARGC
jgi:hypothetical protein